MQCPPLPTIMLIKPLSNNWNCHCYVNPLSIGQIVIYLKTRHPQIFLFFFSCFNYLCHHTLSLLKRIFHSFSPFFRLLKASWPWSFLGTNIEAGWGLFFSVFFPARSSNQFCCESECIREREKKKVDWATEIKMRLLIDVILIKNPWESVWHAIKWPQIRKQSGWPDSVKFCRLGYFLNAECEFLRKNCS
jgi:hypothetical protein